MLTTMHELVHRLDAVMPTLGLPERGPGHGWTLLLSSFGYDQPRIGWAGAFPPGFSTRYDVMHRIEDNLERRGFRCHIEGCHIDGRDYGFVVAVTGYHGITQEA